MPRSLHDRLLASLDPVKGRRLLDQIEHGLQPVHGRGRRRITGRLTPPGISYADWLRQNGYEDLNRLSHRLFAASTAQEATRLSSLSMSELSIKYVR